MKTAAKLMLILALSFSLGSTFAKEDAPNEQSGSGQGMAVRNGYSCGFICKMQARYRSNSDAEDTARKLCNERGGLDGEIISSSIECKDYIEGMICGSRVTIECTPE